MNILIIGTGYVGLVAGVCFAEKGHTVTCVDKDSYKVESLSRGCCTIFEKELPRLLVKALENKKIKFCYTCELESELEKADAVFIAVGTPNNEGGAANLEYVIECVSAIINCMKKDTLIVMKSTVPVGTCEMLQNYANEKNKSGYSAEIAFNPEFLSQGTSVEDFLNLSRIVIGTNSTWAENILREIYKPFNKPILSVDIKSAEASKYACNNFLALKISFINEMANLCEKIGANIDTVSEIMGYDPRIGNQFLKAGIGYGGSCFPKDTQALYKTALENGVAFKTIKAAIEANDYQNTILIEKAEKITSLRNKKTAILGLTFKPETDDLREAPAIKCIGLLIEKGVTNINAYDPVGRENAKSIFKEGIIHYVDSVENALMDAEICFIFTEWKEIVETPLSIFKKHMKAPLVFDGRNCYPPVLAKELGIKYYSIGR